jgi:hypothetical protein|uniref:Uncharacterized protein n=1 Tax=Picea glauca TaxID=3330 RepID=A0A101M4H3_PICGL|nr:hypothetical protein ABT39_MTgene647 [Picea glauca]QHR87023.1 hypothetical protein Q903MT_gene1032 [Picea sitchensis]
MTPGSRPNADKGERRNKSTTYYIVGRHLMQVVGIQITQTTKCGMSRVSYPHARSLLIPEGRQDQGDLRGKQPDRRCR